MKQSNHQVHEHIPVHSNKTLIKASLAATLIAAVVLVLFILPAEYDVDPTGFGQAAGLTELAKSSQAQAVQTSVAEPSQMQNEMPTQMKEAELGFMASEAVNKSIVEQIKAARQTPGLRSDTIDILIPAGKGLEYKLLMDANMHLEYEWHTDGQPLYFDFHGEPKGDTTGYYESFSITTANEMKGSLTTPFAGSHGWYWKNKSDAPVTVTLTTKGDYRIKG
ncbi:hypothetical protein [Shewanella marisflavi]|uniref:hypothetical protein n=1 Tax=Shewanella marisflavi TaxID=260364 RepID=UPI003AAC09CC